MFEIAKPVVGPRRSATSEPVGRVRISPCHGSHFSKTWWRMPVPRVSVRNSVRRGGGGGGGPGFRGGERGGEADRAARGEEVLGAPPAGAVVHHLLHPA